MKTQTSPTDNKNTPAENLLNFLLAGNDKGGIQKTSNIGAVIDALQHLGYKIRAADADPINHTLSALLPDVETVDYRDSDAMDAFVGSLLETEHEGTDLTVLDMPGDSGKALMNYFTPERLEAYREVNIRIIVGLTLVEDLDAIRGASYYAATFHGRAEFTGIASRAKTAADKSFDTATIASFPGGEMINSLIEDRLIVIPRFSERMILDYARVKGVPSAFLPNGPAYRELKLPFGGHFAWQSHRNRVLAAVAPYAEWLCGRPVPRKENVPAPIATDEREDFLRSFQASLKRPTKGK